MPVYRVECAHRTTGSTYPVIIESLSAKDAADYCVAQGHLVGRVLTEVPHFPITGANGDMQTPAAPQGALPPTGLGASPQPTLTPEAAATSAAMAQSIYTLQQALGVHGTGGPDTPLSDAATLRDIADRLAKLQRAPIIARPARTIAYGMMAGFSLMWGLALLFGLLLLLLGITLPWGGGSRAGAAGAGSENVGELKRVQQLLAP